MSEIWVNTERCKKCGICVELCPGKVFLTDQQGFPKPANTGKCTQCQLCELWCPDYAVEVEVQKHEV